MCVCNLFVQHAKHMRRVYFHVACLTFPHYLINVMIFGKKLIDIKCALIFSATLVWNISHSKKNWAMYHKSTLVFLVIFQWNVNFSDILSKNIQISIFMKIRPFGTEFSMVTDRRTNGRRYMTRLIVTFRNFANAPKKGEVRKYKNERRGRIRKKEIKE
jgi:hypothetical protein